MSSCDQWLPAMDAAVELGPKFGGISRAQQAITLALREGLLRARAQVCAYTDVNEECVEEEATPDEPIEIPAQLWHWSDNWAADVMRWSWDDGWFEVRAEDAENDRTFIGVSFCVEDLDRLDPSSSLFDALRERGKVSGAKRGPKPNVRKWGALIGALVELERNNKLRASDYDNPGQLVTVVRNEMPDADLWLDDRTLDRVLGYVWDKHLEGLAAPNGRN